MNFKKYSIIFVLLLTTTMQAEQFEHKFNYFGNLTGTTIDNNNYYIKNYHANTVTNDIKFTPYSKLGIQSTLYDDKIMFVTQIVGNNRDDKTGDITPELTWLNLKYIVNENISFKAGRMQTALFLNSDSLDINYLHNWAKDKNIVYALVPMKFFDGIEINYKKELDNLSIITSLIPYATTKTELYEFVKDGIFDSRDTKMLILEISNDKFRFHTSYLYSKFTINIDDPNYKVLMLELRDNGYNINKYSYTDKIFRQLSMGLEYNIDDFIITTEISQSNDSNSLLPKTTAYYTMIAYTYGDLIPYIMYSQNKNDKNHFNTNNINSTDLEALLYTTNSSEKTITIGSKYYLSSSIALKIQLDKITTYDYGNDYNNIKDREGYASKYTNTPNDDIYQLTFGISFAF